MGMNLEQTKLSALRILFPPLVTPLHSIPNKVLAPQSWKQQHIQEVHNPLEPVDAKQILELCSHPDNSSTPAHLQVMLILWQITAYVLVIDINLKCKEYHNRHNY
jgi:hypothetical protein